MFIRNAPLKRRVGEVARTDLWLALAVRAMATRAIGGEKLRTAVVILLANRMGDGVDQIRFAVPLDFNHGIFSHRERHSQELRQFCGISRERKTRREQQSDA